MLEREAEDRLLCDQVRNIVGAPIPNEWDLGSCRLCGGMEDADKIVVIVWSETRDRLCLENRPGYLPGSERPP